MMAELIVFGMLCASSHWILTRSTITRPVWSRARGKLDELLRCAGCSGFWLGMAWSLLAVKHYGWPVVPVGGVLGAWLTPVFEGAMIWGLGMSAVEDEEVTPVERPTPPRS